MNVLVTGATGFVGTHLVPRLVAAGHDVRALARGDGAARLPVGVERVRGDVTDPDAVAAAAEGVDACVHLVAIIVEKGDVTFDRVNRQGTENVVRALERAGVRRLVHLSALGVGPDERFPYLHTKWGGEEAARAAALDWTVLRPSVLYGEGAGFFRPIVWTLRWMPVYPMVEGGRTRFSPLAVGDLAACVVRSLEGAALRESLDLGGPEVLTFAEIVETCMRALGKRRRIVPVPLWTARPFAFVQGLRRDPLVTNRQLDMVVLDNSCAPDAVERAFGIRPGRFADADLRWLAAL